MKSLLIVLVLTAFGASVKAQTIEPSIVTSTLGVSSDHLMVRASAQGVVDVKYQIAGCSVSATAARTGFKNDLVRLLPAMLSKYPWIKNIKIMGGCPVLDVYGMTTHSSQRCSCVTNSIRLFGTRCVPKTCFLGYH